MSGARGSRRSLGRVFRDPVDLVGAAVLASAVAFFFVLATGSFEIPVLVFITVLPTLAFALFLYLRSLFPGLSIAGIARKEPGDVLAGERGSELGASAAPGPEAPSDIGRSPAGQPSAEDSRGFAPLEASFQPPPQGPGPGASPGPQPSEPSGKGSGASSALLSQGLEALSKIPSRVEELEAEISSLKEEVKQVREDIEQSLTDVRTLLSEISNPFNYMRRFLDEKELQGLVPLVQERGGGADSAPAAGKAGTGSPGGAGSSPRASLEEAKTGSSGEGGGEALSSLVLSAPNISGLMRLIIFVGESLPTLGREGLARLVDLGVSSGSLPQWVRPLMAAVVDLVEETRLPSRRLALMIHRLAKSMGVVDKEAEYLAMILSEEGGRGG